MRSGNSRDAGRIVERYREDPSPENGEVLLQVFAPLIRAYVLFILTGRETRGTSRLASITKRDLVMLIASRFTPADILQEVRLCVLLSARKGHVYNAMPYQVKAAIRRMSEGRTSLNTDGFSSDPDTPGYLHADGGAATVDPEIDYIDLLETQGLLEEDRFLLRRAVFMDMRHEDITVAYNAAYGRSYSRRHISELIHRAKRRFLELVEQASESHLRALIPEQEEPGSGRTAVPPVSGNGLRPTDLVPKARSAGPAGRARRAAPDGE
jgi:hypothetical protein